MATISIADNDARVQYTQAVTANTTQLTIDFPFFDLDDINVIVTDAAGTDTTLSRGTGTGTFAVVGTAVDDGYSGGYITCGDTYAAGTDTFTIFRDIAVSRTTDFPTSGPFNIQSLNTELDRVIAIEQELETKLTRTLQLADSDATVDLKLPNLDTRKGKTLAFNATTGAVEAGPTITGVTTVAALAADIATLADIEDGTVATDAISDTAAIKTNVTTVAGIASNVTTVAGISSDVTAVAADATDIGTVASNISSVNTVATNIADVITVANDLNEAISEVVTVADDLNEAVSEIDTVATSISNVDTVGTNIANVNTVAGISGNVTTVAGISSNVTTVAGISANVTTVAGISSDVTTVAADGTDIGTVATDISNVNTTATNIANVNTVAGISSNVTTVAGISGNVTTVAGISADVTAVAADATDIGTVATNIANVNNVGGSITNVNTVASNLTDVNAFADTYFISATAPSSPTTGDLWFDTSTDTMKVYGGSGFQNAGSSVNGTSERNTYIATAGQTVFNATYDAGYVDVYLNGVKLIDGTDFTATNGTSITLTSGAALNDTVDIVGYGTFELSNFSIDDANDVNTTGVTNGQVLAYNSTSGDFEPSTISSDVVADTTPQLGGNLDTNGNDITFGDNDRAQFGASNDLQIYHDGTNSYIYENGTGDLRIATNGGNIRLQKTLTEKMGDFNIDGSVDLYYDNVKKFETTSSGVDVTGDFSASGHASIGASITDSTRALSIAGSTSDTLARALVCYNSLLNNELISIRNDGYISGASAGFYPSGGIYLGGTGSANHLQDYEEGSFTATLTGSASNPTTAVTSNSARYTKVGRLVHVSVTFSNKDTTGASGAIRVSGLPFSSPSSTHVSGNVAMHTRFVASTNSTNISPFISGNNIVSFYVSHSTNAWYEVNHSAGTGFYLYFTVLYEMS